MVQFVRSMAKWAVVLALAVGSAAPAQADVTNADKQFEVKFEKAEWSTVIEWLSKETDLQFISKHQPKGQVTLKPAKKLSIGELIDQLNAVADLEDQLIIRKEISFAFHPTDERISLSMTPLVTLEQLAKRGKTEYVGVIVPLVGIKNDTIRDQVRKSLSQFGEAQSYGTDQLMIRDKVENIQLVITAIKKQIAKGSAPVDANQDSASGEKLYEVNFTATEWPTVIGWLVEETGLQFISKHWPTGKVTLNPKKKLKLAEVIDLLNEYAALEDTMLLRKELSFSFCKMDGRIPMSATPLVTVEELATRGNTEYVGILLPMPAIDTADMQKVLRQMLGGNGEAQPYGTGQLLIRDQAANVRAIMESLQK